MVGTRLELSFHLQVCGGGGGDGGEFLIPGDTQPFHSQAPKAMSGSLQCLLQQPAWSGLTESNHSTSLSDQLPWSACACVRREAAGVGLHSLGQDRSPAMCSHLCVSLAQLAFPEGSPSRPQHALATTARHWATFSQPAQGRLILCWDRSGPCIFSCGK